jgi:hypothetical protein
MPRRDSAQCLQFVHPHNFVNQSPRLARLTAWMKFVVLILAVSCAWGQSAGKEIGRVAGDIGKGAAKGVGNLAKGAGKGALDLATLHPISAAASLGKGAGTAGKDVTVGALKGTGKIGKGVGKAIKKLF